MWKISKRYGVDYKELLRLNSQIRNPDKITPGMKVKVPTNSVPLRQRENNINPNMFPPAKERPIPAPAPLPEDEESPMTPMVPPSTPPTIQAEPPAIPPAPPRKEMPLPPTVQMPAQPPVQMPAQPPVPPAVQMPAQPRVQQQPMMPPAQQPMVPMMPPMQQPMQPMMPHPHFNLQLHLYWQRQMQRQMQPYMRQPVRPPMMHQPRPMPMHPSSSMWMDHCDAVHPSPAMQAPSPEYTRKAPCSSCGGESSRSYGHDQSSMYYDSYSSMANPMHDYTPVMPPMYGAMPGSSAESAHPHMHSYMYPSSQAMPQMPERDVWPTWEHGYDESSSSC